MPRTIHVICAFALVGVVSACGGPDQSDEESGSGAPFDSVGELAGAVQAASAESGSAQLAISIDGAPVGTGALQVGEERSDLSLAWQQGDEQLGTLVVDQQAYLKASAAGEDWVQIDPAAGPGTDAATLRYLAEQAIAAADPVRALGQQAEAASIINTETEEIDGIEATRYDFEVDLVAMAENAGEPADAALYAMSIQAGNDGLSSTMWTDESGRPVRFSTELTAVNGMITTTTVDYRQWGEPVEIAAPGEGQVTPAAEVAASEVAAVAEVSAAR